MDIILSLIFYLVAIFGLIILISRPHFTFYLIIIFSVLPTWIKDIPISISKINIYIDDLLLLFLIIYFTFYILLKIVTRKPFFESIHESRFIITLIFLYLLLNIGFIFTALYQGVPLDSSIRRFINYSSFFFFFLPLITMNNEKKIRNILRFTAIIAVCYLPWQIYSFLTKPAWRIALDATSSGTIRLGSGGMSTVACGLFIILIWKNSLKYYLMATLPLISFLLIGHRSAYLALGISMPFIYLWIKGFTKSIIYVPIVIILLTTSLLSMKVFLKYDFLGDSLTRINDTFNSDIGTTKARFNAISDNFYIFKKRPLTGIGYNHESLPKLFRDSPASDIVSDTDLILQVSDVLHPHNFVLHLLSHTGILGTTLIFLIILNVLYKSYKTIKNRGSIKQFGVFFFSSITFFVVLSLMNTTFTSEGPIFWILCGGTCMLIPSKFKLNDENFLEHSAP